MEKYLETGKIVSTQGLKGEIRAEVWSDSIEFICSLEVLYINKGEKALKIEYARRNKNVAIIKFEGIDTIDDAVKLRGKTLYLDRDDADLKDGDYFIVDLLGLKVVDSEKDIEYGIITDVLQTGANDVYEITKDDKKYYIPAIKQVVLQIDLENGKIIIKPMEGLFDDED